jgi:acyl carrier protein
MLIKNKINNILKKNKVDIKKYSIKSNLIQLGVIDSMQLLIIISELEKIFKIKIDTHLFYKSNFGSIHSFYKIVEKLINGNKNSKKKRS